jgi:hypothetical protein
MPYGVVVAICPFDLAHVVARQQHGQAARGEALDQGAHVADAGRVEAVGGLVEHQQARVAQQRGRDAEALAHTERVAAYFVALAAAQVDRFEDLVDARGLAPPSRPASSCRFLWPAGCARETGY